MCTCVISVIAAVVIYQSEPSFTMSSNMDALGNDIHCYDDGSSADFCKTKCISDKTCKGYAHVNSNSVLGTKSGYCYKTKNTPINCVKWR
jgi:hypothetical protein